MKIKKMVESFNYAIDGVIIAVRTQRNMKIHLLGALLVLILCFLCDISKNEFLVLAITITMVISAELINTAIEATIDLSTNYYHPLAKIAKNTSAGAVLITAINAVIVGYIIFWDELTNMSFKVVNKVKESEPYMIFIAITIVILATLIIKAIYGEGTPLKGGMPSGHSAIAFSLATAISLITEEAICILLSYLIAIITAQSRIDSGIHSVLEVVIGGLMGILLTLLVFTLFRI